MKEIKNEACPKDHDLPGKLEEYLKGYLGKVSILRVLSECLKNKCQRKNNC